MRASAVEQVFVRRRGGLIEVSFVLEDPSGARTRETLPTPMRAPAEGVRFAARALARRGLRPAARVRLRVDRQGELSDDAALRAAFLEALADASGLARDAAEGDAWDRG